MAESPGWVQPVTCEFSNAHWDRTNSIKEQFFKPDADRR
jgi:hypothetical protein